MVLFNSLLAWNLCKRAAPGPAGRMAVPEDDMPDFASRVSLTLNRTQNRSSAKRKDRVRLAVEGLEDRVVPTIFFQPQFGNESVTFDPTNPPGLIDPTVNVVFSGSSWNLTIRNSWNGPLSKSTFETSIQSILSGPYLNSIRQYGYWGQAMVGQVWTDNTLVSNLPVPGHTGDPPLSSVQTFLQNSINYNHKTTPVTMPSRFTPVYVVISDISTSGPAGWNGPGSYSGTSGNVPIDIIWLGVVHNWDGSANKDAFTMVFSHEIAECISSIGSVQPGAKWIPPQGTSTNQIADSEPDQKYTYRVNGDLVQAYWSDYDHAYVVANGNTQQFGVRPANPILD